MFIHGRSDTTLNPGGVRIGTSDYYKVLEQIGEIEDAVVVGQSIETEDKIDKIERVVLFVVMKKGEKLGDRIKKEISSCIRNQLSPKHVPQVIEQVSGVPVNLNFKKMEMLVKRIVDGESIEEQLQTPLINAECLEDYKNFARRSLKLSSKL